MSHIIPTADLNPASFSKDEMLWIYNGLDATLTHEIHQRIRPQLDPNAELIYKFEQAMQAPALEMTLRGFRIDMAARARMLKDLEAKRERANWILSRLGLAITGEPINANSPHQLKNVFYKTLGVPEQFKIEKGERKVSTNREALEKIESYFYARPVAKAVTAARDVIKKISVLHSGIDPDSRMRFGYAVAGTETGRWSSSSNAFGTGTNGQNITEELRPIFVADPGYRLCYVDLEQAESRLVGILTYLIFGDSKYLDACESGDLHTTVCKMVWPGLGWSSDPKENKILAESPFYRQYSYRDMSKRGGHGSNYYGQARTMAMHLKVQTELMVEFQKKYFGEFPAIPRWHQWTAQQIQLHAKLCTPVGRVRHFFGRLTDDSTLREAIAYTPQSTIGDLLNLGLWRLWHRHGNEIQILAQVHDAVVFQYPEALHHKVPIYEASIRTPLQIKDRTVILPTEAKTGWNWGKAVTPKDQEKYTKAGRVPPALNSDGLLTYSSNDTRSRQTKLESSLLDRRFL